LAAEALAGPMMMMMMMMMGNDETNLLTHHTDPGDPLELSVGRPNRLPPVKKVE
jgi:hypothetical protein